MDTRLPSERRLIIGHANMDLDCLGSLALASRLFPDHMPVRSRVAHPAVREALTVYGYEIPMLSLKDVKGERPSSLVVVDTRSKSRVREFWDAFAKPPEQIRVYDHHSSEDGDIPGAQLVENPYGAQATAFALMCQEAGLSLNSELSTVALAGIYADTGNFTYEGTSRGDFEAALWLKSQGASLKMVQRLLRPLREPFQADLFHRAMGNLTWRRFHGHVVALSRVDCPEQVAGVGEVADRIFAAEPVDVLFLLVRIENRGHELVVGRSRKDRFNLLEVLESLGGRGHPSAASALVKDGRDVWSQLLALLETVPVDALTAADLMTRTVTSIPPSLSIVEASMLMEDTGHTGFPVVEDDGTLVGVFTLRDVSQARRAEAMKAPVQAYMAKRTVVCSPSDTIREVERLMLGHNVGHLPVMSGTKMIGLITRGDYKRVYS
ncbi:MAG: CBS domain-containing protein [Spirochaetales bacterium]|nr:CBS domain-containing protein [Spirochaetales bacterium]